MMYEDDHLEMDYEDRVSGTFNRELEDEYEDDPLCVCSGCGSYASIRMLGEGHVCGGEYQ